MFKIALLTLFFAPWLSWAGTHNECQSIYQNSEQLLETFYIDESFEQEDFSLLKEYLISTKSCKDKIWNLRLKTMELYIVLLSPKAEGKILIEDLNSNWDVYLSDHGFIISNMSALEGFSEFLNSIRLQYKVLSNEQRAHEGEKLQKLQLYYSGKAVEVNHANKWVLYNQHLNSQLNFLTHINSYGSQTTYCKVVNKLNNFTSENRQYFTESQLEIINSKYGKKYSKKCNI